MPANHLDQSQVDKATLHSGINFVFLEKQKNTVK